MVKLQTKSKDNGKAVKKVLSSVQSNININPLCVCYAFKKFLVNVFQPGPSTFNFTVKNLLLFVEFTSSGKFGDDD